MDAVSLESLAQRVAVLEQIVMARSRLPFSNGMAQVRSAEDLEFARRVDTEAAAWRERERQADLAALDGEDKP